MRRENGPPEGEYVDANGVRLHFQVFGEGEDVVFLHGSGPGNSAWANFRFNYQALVDAGYRVWLLDMIGFGYSDKPTDKGDYTLDLFCDTVAAAMSAWGVGSAHFIGNSLGGGVAIQLALRDPKIAKKLVLMGPGCLEPQADYFSMPGIAKMMAAMGAGVTADNLKDVLLSFVFDPKHITDELVAMRWAIAESQPKEVLTTMKTPALGEQMSALTCPILTFWGADDAFMPPQGKETCIRANAHSRLVEINACGHWVMIEQARLFNALTIDFLAHG
ncbi:MAG: alpha/beta hydrolase [Pseudomonadota bacterium]